MQWEECENIGDRTQTHTYMYSNSDLPDNSTCWFWVKDVSYELNEGDAVCSRDAYCIISQGKNTAIVSLMHCVNDLQYVAINYI